LPSQLEEQDGAAIADSEAATAQAVVSGQPVSRDVFVAEECPVCFEPMGGACPLRRLACGHGFHYSCIQRWLQQNATCPLCKADTPGPPPASAAFKVDLGHQEMTQIMHELEDIFLAVHACVGPERAIAVNGLAYNLCASIGYEDEDELEEAIGGTLVDFLNALPHFEVVWEQVQRAPEDGSVACEEGEAVMEDVAKATMKPPPDVEDLSGPGTRTAFTVSGREDLWRVVLQGPCADIEIPEIEFEIRPRERRRVDTIYNIIAAAVFHLGDHVQKNTRAGAMTEDDAAKICVVIDSLNQLLDVEQPFNIIIKDPQGVSELKPLEGAHVETFVAQTSGTEDAS